MVPKGYIGQCAGQGPSVGAPHEKCNADPTDGGSLCGVETSAIRVERRTGGIDVPESKAVL